MSTGAIHSLITADNSDFRAALAAVEGDTSRAMGRVGAVVKTSARGYRDLSGAILGTVGVAGLIAGSIGAGVNGLMDMLDVQKRVNDEVRAERRERDGIVRAARDTRMALEARLGLREATPNRDAAKAQIDAMIAQRDKMQAEADALRTTERGFERLGLGSGPSGLSEFLDGTDTKAREAEAGVASLNSEIDRMINLLNAAKLADAKVLGQKRLELARDIRSANEGDRVAMLKLEGRETAALRQEENQRFRDALEHITRIEAETGMRFARERDQAQERHREEMDRIGREAGARARAAREGAVLSGREMDAEEARASGDTAKAKRIDEEIRLYRQLREIKRSSLDDEEKRRRSLQAIRTSALRLRDADRMDDPTRDAAIRSGTGRNDALMRQVFPGSSAAASAAQTTANASKQTADAAKSLLQAVTQIVTNGLKVPAVLAR